MIVTLKLFDPKCKTSVDIDLFNVKEIIYIHSLSMATLVFNDGTTQDVGTESIDFIKQGVSDET